MPVYIDDAKLPFRNMKMCHMIADTDAELMDMAARLGLRPEWKHRDHFDLCITKRQAAIDLGAVEVTQHGLARRVIVSRGKKAAPSDKKDLTLF